MSSYADQGTAAHWVLEQCLIYEFQLGVGNFITPRNWIGTLITIPGDQEGDHARLSPSGAKRWMSCAQAPRMADRFPEQPQPERTVEFTEEDAEAVQMCVDYIRTRVTHIHQQTGKPPYVIAERSVSPRRFLKTDQCDGTSDVTLHTENWSFIEHIDYKHGKGVPVSEDDPQNDLYLLGTLAAVPEGLPGPKAARLTIVQPRCDKVEPRIRSRWIPDVQIWADQFKSEVLQAIAMTEDPDAPFSPSEDACRWCPGSRSASGEYPCQAYVDHCLAGARIPPSPTDGIFKAATQVAMQDTDLIDDDKLVAILDIREMLAGMLSAIERTAVNRILKGNPGPLLTNRYKVVYGQSRRRWSQEEDETVAALKKLKFADPAAPTKMRALKKTEMYSSKLDSPAGIEKKLKAMHLVKAGWEVFNQLTEKPDGKYVLVPQSDPRNPVPTKPSAAEAFADVPPTPNQSKRRTP